MIDLMISVPGVFVLEKNAAMRMGLMEDLGCGLPIETFQGVGQIKPYSALPGFIP
jgi:hypothetical protein